jgi:D-serine deaminase-like pyridoxal phosphate-dependent protein
MTGDRSTPLESLETPALVIDVARLERNLERWQRYCDEAGLANRPHVKTHKSIEIARRQVALGARGITCQKLGEAEVMVEAGIDDVLIPYNLLGNGKLERLSSLLGRARISVSVDDVRLLVGLAAAARTAGRELEVSVECDTGMGRAGVQSPEAAVELAAVIARADGLRFGGFVTYPAPAGAAAFLQAAVDGARACGLEVPVVSAGGTPGMWHARELMPTVTEYRAGTYAFHDRATVAAGAAGLEDVAVTVHATVASRPTRDRAIVDAGSKALAYDPGPGSGHGLILEAQGSVIETLTEEHGHVRVCAPDRLELGDRVRIVPNHVCVVSNLFDEFWVARDGAAVGRWPVAARGRSQ